ncbi:MAG: XRE family transcriptional regulator [Candidatus Micrarchaeota archaeon]
MGNIKGKKVYKDFSKHAESSLGPERFARAKTRAAEEVKRILLTELREKLELNQTDVKGFRQADVSKIENRTDMKLSTLIKYVTEGLGAEIEIKARLKGSQSHKEPEEVTLFRELPGKRRASGK